MASSVVVSESVADSIQEVKEANENLDAEHEKKFHKKMEALKQRGEPVSILVIGPTGSGKSTLINALMGDTVARVGEGATSVTSEAEKYAGEYEGVKIRVYDTVGFSDSKGKGIMKEIEEIADTNKFDLVLVCVRLDSEADHKVKRVFSELIKLPEEISKRSVVVLTFANMFAQLDIMAGKSVDAKAQIMNDKIRLWKRDVSGFLSGQMKEEIIHEIPFCIAGRIDKKQLPTTDDWLRDLWVTCIGHCVSSEAVSKAMLQESKEKIRQLCEKGEPVNILVIGPTGAGKSTLVNNLMGMTVAEADYGALSATRQVTKYAGEYEGIKIRVYDMVGFNDTEGKSGQSLIKETADGNKFDLVLICVRMDCRASGDVRKLLIMLGKELNEEMWKRSVIVLTFYNMFLLLGSVEDSGDVQKAVQDEIKEYQTVVSYILSGSVNDEIISGIPYCVAGMELPPEETWLPLLWSVCLKRCSDNAQPLLKGVSKFELIAAMSAVVGVGTAASTAVGAGIGAGVGAIVTGATAAGGAVVGAGIGAAVIPGLVGLAVVVGGVVVVADWLMTKKEPQKKPKKKND